MKEDFEAPLQGAVKFLTGSYINKDILQCMRDNSEGKYHRHSTQTKEEFEPYSAHFKRKLANLQEEIYSKLEVCLKSGKCIDAINTR